MVAVFRADASSQIGVGHLTRCLCLADGLKKRGVECLFASKDYRGNLFRKVEQKGFRVETIDAGAGLDRDLDLTTQAIKKHRADVLVTDSYDINSDYLRNIKGEVRLLLSIDDLVQTHFYADILLNQNLGVREEDYQDKIEPYTKLLLGPEYALLRDEFAERHARKKQISYNAKNILVTLGGGDPDNQTLKVVRGLKTINSLYVNVLLGPSYQDTGELERFVEDNGGNICILKNCQDVAERMRWADLAVSSGGSTCWEMACLGLPNSVMVLADNQRRIAQALDNQGISVNLGWFEQVTEADIKRNVLELLSNPRKREQMSKKGQQLVDGRGVERVSKEIFHLLERWGGYGKYRPEYKIS